MNDKYHDEFYSNIDKIKVEYKKHPKEVNDIVKDTLIKINNIDSPKKRLTDEAKSNLMLAISGIMIACFGFLNLSSIGMYIFGIIFFIAGFLVAINNPGMGIIFLFSHGLTGFCLMNVPIIVELFENPILTENPLVMKYIIAVLIIITMVLLVLTIIISYVRERSDASKKVLIILWGYGLVTLFVQILPRIIDKIIMLF